MQHRILVVDDNADGSRLVCRILRRANFDVAEVGEYQLALATLAQNRPLSALVVGFSIAGSGASLKLLDAVRSHPNPEVRNLRVVFITDHPRQLLFAWQAGVDDTLVRPFHEAELRHAVNGVVGRAEEQRDAYRAAQIRRLSRPDYQHTQGGE